MKCFVCGTEHNSSLCPVCEFEEVFVPGIRSSEEIRRLLAPMIEEHKNKFRPKVQVGMVLYRYDVGDGASGVTETEERAVFGNLKHAAGGAETLWLKQKFDTASECGMVDVHLVVYVAGTSFAKDLWVTVPQIADAEKQEIGLCVDDEFRFSVVVRSDTGKTVTSDQYPLFG